MFVNEIILYNEISTDESLSSRWWVIKWTLILCSFNNSAYGIPIAYSTVSHKLQAFTKCIMS